MVRRIWKVQVESTKDKRSVYRRRCSVLKFLILHQLIHPIKVHPEHRPNEEPYRAARWKNQLENGFPFRIFFLSIPTPLLAYSPSVTIMFVVMTQAPPEIRRLTFRFLLGRKEEQRSVCTKKSLKKITRKYDELRPGIFELLTSREPCLCASNPRNSQGSDFKVCILGFLCQWGGVGK